MDDVPEELRDAGYALVGLGVLWFQRAQVLRREVVRDLPELARPLAGAVREAVGLFRSAVKVPPPPHPGG